MVNPQEHGDSLPDEGKDAGSKNRQNLTSRLSLEMGERMCRTMFSPNNRRPGPHDLRFVDLAEEAKEGGIPAIIHEMRRIYEQRIFSQEILRDCMIQGGTHQERTARHERLRAAMLKGGYLFPFNGEKDSVREGLERDLQDPNYGAFGLRDPEDGHLVAYSTAYYPGGPHGEWSTTELATPEEREELEKEMAIKENVAKFGPPVPLPEKLTRYALHICTHLSRIVFMVQDQRRAWMEKFSSRVIGYDTIGVEAADPQGKPQPRKAIGIRMMYETCRELLRRLPERGPDEDWILASYRFRNLIPMVLHPETRKPEPMAQWNDVQEITNNIGSAQLFTKAGFQPLGTHQEKRNLVRPDPGAPQDLIFGVIWLDEYSKITTAMQSWLRALSDNR